MEEKRFYLTRVRIVKEEGTPYAVGEVYCAIADREELNNTFSSSQPYGIIHTPIDAAKVSEIIAAANRKEIANELYDPSYIDWVFKGDCDCEEV